MRRAKRIIGALFLIAMLPGLAERAQAEESLGSKIKKIFAPTPTPAPRKHRKSSTASKKKEETEKSPTPKPSASPEKSKSLSSSKKKKSAASPTPAETPEPSPSASPKKEKKSSPAPDASPGSSRKKKPKPRSSPTPAPGESTPPSSPTATPEVNETPSVSPSAKKKGGPATIAANQISDYEDYPPNVHKIVDTALELTTRNLNYKYGSADPGSGGMDCSGFIFYVLTQNGIRDVPRDSSQQYVWLRKAGNFKAVNSRREDTFELDELVPGDLLFWTGTYSIERDPPITHVMVYLGREKGTRHRIMVGASDGRSYKGESRYGVSVFDFKIPRPPGKTEEGGTTPSFIGYGHIPGL